METLVQTRPSLQFLTLPLTSEPEGLTTYRQCREAARAAEQVIADISSKLAPPTSPTVAAPNLDTYLRGAESKAPRDRLHPDPTGLALAGWAAIFATPCAIGAALCAADAGHSAGAWLCGITAALIPVATTVAVLWRHQVAKLSNQARDLEEKVHTLSSSQQRLTHELATERWQLSESQARRATHGDSVGVEDVGALGGLLRSQPSSEAANTVARRIGWFAEEKLKSHPDDMSAKAYQSLTSLAPNQHTVLGKEAAVATCVQVFIDKPMNEWTVRHLERALAVLDTDVQPAIKADIRAELFDGVHCRFPAPQPIAEALRAVLDRA